MEDPWRCAIGYSKYMADIYERLRGLGFNTSFLRARVLPDWWADALAENPTNRALAEGAIARHLHFKIADLRDPNVELSLPKLRSVRLKRSRNVKYDDIELAMLVAQHVVNLLAALLPPEKFRGPMDASAIRNKILTRCTCVDLRGLVDFCWDSGIAVVHLGELPKKSKKFSGMALFCKSRPFIVLASGRDSPPWLAFHLAHELAHIMLGHVVEGGDPFADSNIDELDNDEQEREADRYACKILAGQEDPSPKLQKWNAPKLAKVAEDFGQANGVDPGTVALIYGRANGRMPVAQNALKILRRESGGRQMITEALRDRIVMEDLPESTARFLSLVIPDDE